MFNRSILATAVVAALASMAGQAAQAATGPSSSQTPYITPTAAGWSVTSILTVGDSVNNKPDATPYRMVGIPDGLGAYDSGVKSFGGVDYDTFTVLMNHELGSSAGITRAHGAAGAFVSEWVISKSDFRVLNGSDLITSHQVATGSGTWGAASGAANSFNRFCSADLPAVSAFYNAATGLGTQARIFMNGEEAGAEGRAYGIVATGSDKGKAYQLPSLGRFSWENSLANPYSGNRTVVIGTDDSSPGQVYLYVGNKSSSGNEIQKAGLDGGSLYGIAVAGKPTEPNNTSPATGSFTAVALSNNQWNSTGASLQSESTTKGVTEFGRPEDGHWADEKTFYFVTTGRSSIQGKLYKMDFKATLGDGSVDYTQGEISVILDSTNVTGKDGAKVPIAGFDNMTVTNDGKIIIQDDPGNNAYNAKIWLVDPSTGAYEQIFESDRARFGTTQAGNALPATAPFNVDEENSGVIEVTDVLNRNDGNRYFLGVMQAHYGISGELVEGGQLYVMAVPEPETYALMGAGLGLLGVVARRRRKA